MILCKNNVPQVKDNLMQFNKILVKLPFYFFFRTRQRHPVRTAHASLAENRPLYKDRLAHVWLWNDFPFRKDLGVKMLHCLVAKTILGEYGGRSNANVSMKIC
jgi:hypothetical protein